jgi:hypothetical protein
VKRLLSPLFVFSIAAVCCGQPATEYDRFGGVMSLTGTKTGWFHVAEIDDRWYFVTPEGHAFFSLGATNAGGHTMDNSLDAAGSKYSIGIHGCTARDYQPWNTRYHRRGLLKADDTPYPILVDYTQRTNKRVHELVYATTKEKQK